MNIDEVGYGATNGGGEGEAIRPITKQPFLLGRFEVCYNQLMPLVKRVSENGKIYAKLSDIEPWELNPRIHDDEGLLGLKKQLAEVRRRRRVMYELMRKMQTR